MHSSHTTLSDVHVITLLLVVKFLPSTRLAMVIFFFRRGPGDMQLSNITRLTRISRSSVAAFCGLRDGPSYLQVIDEIYTVPSR